MIHDRARDTRLGRDVALKVLPQIFADDPERMARFEREAQVLASLNHPNIAQLYGVEERALVMEYVPGDTLRCPLPLEEALPILRQIIDALEEAHERGIVHRDLKPANIKITPEGKVKVLDFGLAKTLADDSAASNASNSPTLASTALTRGAVLLGTAAYMSPEQARGKTVDKRSDIFVFGAVLYEMLTGRQAFAGETISDSLAAILKNKPDRSLLPAATPGNVRLLLDRCLEKDPKKRLRDIGEARILLEEPDRSLTGPEGTPARKDRRAWLAWAVTAIVTVTSVVGLWRMRPPRSLRPALIRFTVAPPENSSVDSLSLSPDGRYLAIAAAVGTGRSLWLRAIDTVELRPLPGTEDARFPFWSPDSRFLGFFAGGKLKKVAVRGGPPQTLCDAAEGQGGTWNQEGVILFAAESRSTLFQVPAAGGAPVPVPKPEER
ncbi:MAG TPA: serine/threonine-protein kinase, partial [Gemmataceae bacterium]|nr:serine/threonine-protein kinase [Gemmataceae bacterium]